MAAFVEHGLSIVAFDRQAQPVDDLPIDSVTVDNVLAGRLATEHLLNLGHRRIGFVTGPVRTVNRQGRLEGYRKTLAEFGVAPDPDLIWEKALDKGFGDTEGVELGRSGAQELLSKPNRPTALIAINDMYAFGAYAGARDLGLRVPNDISIVGIDDGVLAQVVDPPLTTVRQPLCEMTQAAVDIVISRIEGKDDGPPHHLVMKPELIVRQSTTQVRS
ncbi:MAG: hypothetical protein A2Z03_00690 [Chloroflexi bacterium RBG_16_56_8]|nr:MAG: hypothetical protein A2Z03_00690 [Chloroflexi bacterium RBG_16_56_8]